MARSKARASSSSVTPRRSDSFWRRSSMSCWRPSGGRVAKAPSGRMRSERTSQAALSRSGRPGIRGALSAGELHAEAEVSELFLNALAVVALDFDRAISDGAARADEAPQLDRQALHCLRRQPRDQRTRFPAA